MKNVIIVICQNDIPAAEYICKSLDTYEVFVFDPSLIDKMANTSLENIRFLSYDGLMACDDIRKNADDAAVRFENELNEHVGCFLDEVSIKSWNHISYLHFFLDYIWYTALWNKLTDEMGDVHFYVLLYDNPSYFYFPSFNPPLLLLNALIRKNIEFSAYNYGGKYQNANIVPDLFEGNSAKEKFDVLVHVPTCLYDYNYFSSEIKATGKSVVCLKSIHWDVPFEASTTVGVRNSDEGGAPFLATLQPAIDLFIESISEKLNLMLGPFIRQPQFRNRQVHFISSLYRSQVVTYLLLKEYFKYGVPGKVVLSEHDTGFHGPIVSFAEKNRIPILFVPHSKISADIEFNGENAISLTHPLQGNIPFDRNGKRMVSFKLSFPEVLTCSTAYPQRIRKVGLLLNGISANGVSVDFNLYLKGIREISHWCRKNGIELGIRCRPGMTLFKFLEDHVGIDRASLLRAVNCPITEFANSYDLCLMYGTPTTGAIEYLKNAIPILNPISEDLSRAAAAIADTNIIPRGSIGTILGLLDSFLSDTTNFSLFRTDQFKKYVNSFGDSYPLRHFL